MRVTTNPCVQRIYHTLDATLSSSWCWLVCEALSQSLLPAKVNVIDKYSIEAISLTYHEAAYPLAFIVIVSLSVWLYERGARMHFICLSSISYPSGPISTPLEYTLLPHSHLCFFLSPLLQSVHFSFFSTTDY